MWICCMCMGFCQARLKSRKVLPEWLFMERDNVSHLGQRALCAAYWRIDCGSLTVGGVRTEICLLF